MNKRMRPLTDQEEADINAQIAADPDDWVPTDEELSQARPFTEVFPDLAENMRRSRGRPPVENPKVHVSLRLDAVVIKKFKSTGPGWQGRINDALKKAEVD